MSKPRLCGNCGRKLTGQQRLWCSESCGSAGRRSTEKAGAAPDSLARRRFLASLDGYEFAPHEQVAVDHAASAVATIEALESIPEPSLAILREIRAQKLAVLALMRSIDFPDEDAGARSEEMTALARGRWSGRG